MKPKSVIMIGGGVQEIEAVHIAQSMGLRVIVTDRNPDAPCLPYADFTAVIDGRDIEGLVAFALLNKEKLNIAGVFTLTELVTSVAAVALGAGLPGVPLKSAVACQNKAICKEIWRKKGIPTPKSAVANSFEEVRLLFDEFGREIFVKPVVGYGGQSSGKISSLDELESFFGKNKIDRKSIIVEELIKGTMHDVNGLITSDDLFHPLGIVDRAFLDDWPVEIKIRSPTVLTEKQQREVYALLEKGVRALGIDFGPVKGDVVLTDSGFQLLEVAPRLHGPKNSLYVLPMSGFNPLVPTLFSITGQQVSVKDLVIRQNCYCICKALLPPPGRIIRLEGVEEALRLCGIKHIMMFVTNGDVIHPYRNSTHVPGYVFTTGNTLEACNKITRKAISMIRFVIETLQ